LVEKYNKSKSQKIVAARLRNVTDKMIVRAVGEYYKNCKNVYLKDLKKYFKEQKAGVNKAVIKKVESKVSVNTVKSKTSIRLTKPPTIPRDMEGSKMSSVNCYEVFSHIYKRDKDLVDQEVKTHSIHEGKKAQKDEIV
jgi:hypothetical protein